MKGRELDDPYFKVAPRLCFAPPIVELPRNLGLGTFYTC